MKELGLFGYFLRRLQLMFVFLATDNQICRGSGRHSNSIQFLFEAEISWFSDQNVRFERKRRNVYIVKVPAAKGCLFRQENPRRLGCQNGENFFLPFFSPFLRRCALLLPCYDQHSPNSQTLPPSMGLLRLRTNHIKVDTNFHHTHKKIEKPEKIYFRRGKVFSAKCLVVSKVANEKFISSS